MTKESLLTAVELSLFALGKENVESGLKKFWGLAEPDRIGFMRDLNCTSGDIHLVGLKFMKNKYLPIIFSRYKTFADFKGEEDIELFKNRLSFNETDLKEIFNKNKPKKDINQSSSSKVYTPKPKPQFNYPLSELQKQINTLEEWEEFIQRYFPTIVFESKACLATYASLALKNLNGCPSLNLVGNPSGEKTTALSFFYGQEHSYISDDFTPRAFVSHSANVKAEQLQNIDLLPRIQNKVLITPELAPLFQASKEELLPNFAMLTRVLDGEGLNRDSGTQGHRGYSGDYKFIWLGATTPLKSSVWNVMGAMGNRLFFLSMGEKNRTNEDYVSMFQTQAYGERVNLCRSATHSFLNNFFKKNPIRSVSWGVESDEILSQIVRYGKLLAQLRGSLVTWRSGEERGEYEFASPIIEEPPRAINALLNFARGWALISNRNYLIEEDLEIVRRVCLSSMPHDRKILLEVLTKHGGRASSADIAQELNCSDDTALRTMKVLSILRVCDIKEIGTGNLGRPLKFVELKPEFQELLIDTQPLKSAVKSKPQEIKGEGAWKNGVSAWENTEKLGHAQVLKPEENTFPHENKPVFDYEEVDLP